MTQQRLILACTLLSLGTVTACSGKAADGAIGANSAGGAASNLVASHASAGNALTAPPAAAIQVTEAIAAAPGGKTIADVWANRKTLAGKSVTVRGKIVKFNGAILGTNWLHIQDGSGSAKDGTNDLTVTSDGAAKVGDVVTVTGTIAIDKDFGAGYAYAVILEKASVVVK